uniref:Integrin beta n=1 Tax=Scleropages formosus TaxID=113540 RepID=A0A8C9VJV2_SCLFO
MSMFQDFLKSGESNERRCDTPEALEKRRCSEKNIFNPEPSVDPLKDAELQNKKENVVQLRPQNLNLKLRVGVPETFTVTFKRAEGYPIDLYYLMDLSYSMQDDLEKIKTLGQEILNTLMRVTNKVRIGFGCFVDKVGMPYVSTVKAKLANPCPSRLDTCQPAFSFRNVLRLTEDAREFREQVSKQIISGNLDSPEGGFDAMMQVAVCQDEIGWGNVTRILVYTSDDTFHMAGDGRLAGIYQPNDGKCHLNRYGLYDKGNEYDYPSVGHLSRVLSANNIQLIFAVTEKSVPAYKALSELIPQSVVGELKNDSSNVVQLISEAYGNLSSTVLLEHLEAPQGLNISFKSHCGNGEPSDWKKSGKCNNVKIEQQVCQNCTVRRSEALRGASFSLKVNVETLCACNCGDREEGSPSCNGNGNLECGVCSCNKGHLGQKCECQRQGARNTTLTMEALCRREKDSQLCSGQGICECGTCVCRGHFRGNFCECDDSSCGRHNNKICNGQGICDCGTCKCHANYIGPTCECSTKTDKCTNKDNVLCNNHGDCECNRCKCHAGFIHDFLAEWTLDVLNACASWLIFQTSVKLCIRSLSNAQHMCSSNTLTRTFTHPIGAIDMTALVLGSSVSGVVLIGIAIIIIYRVLLEVYDRREYRRFLLEQQNVQWKENQNPLFKDATTTVFNPLHSEY